MVTYLTVYRGVVVLVFFALGFLLGRMQRRKTERDRRAEEAAAALEGFSRVDGHLLPLPTDPRWEKDLTGLEIKNVVHLEKTTSSLDDVDTFTVRIGGGYLTGDKVKRTKRTQKYGTAVIAAYRERIVRGGAQ